MRRIGDLMNEQTQDRISQHSKSAPSHVEVSLTWRQKEKRVEELQTLMGETAFWDDPASSSKSHC